MLKKSIKTKCVDISIKGDTMFIRTHCVLSDPDEDYRESKKLISFITKAVTSKTGRRYNVFSDLTDISGGSALSMAPSVRSRKMMVEFFPIVSLYIKNWIFITGKGILSSMLGFVFMTAAEIIKPHTNFHFFTTREKGMKFLKKLEEREKKDKKNN